MGLSAYDDLAAWSLITVDVRSDQRTFRHRLRKGIPIGGLNRHLSDRITFLVRLKTTKGRGLSASAHEVSQERHDPHSTSLPAPGCVPDSIRSEEVPASPPPSCRREQEDDDLQLSRMVQRHLSSLSSAEEQEVIREWERERLMATRRYMQGGEL